MSRKNRRKLGKKFWDRFKRLRKKHKTDLYDPLYASLEEYAGLSWVASEHSLQEACEEGRKTECLEAMKKVVEGIKKGDFEYNTETQELIYLDEENEEKPAVRS